MRTLIETMRDDRDVKRFVELLEAAEMTDHLASHERYTVFAPRNPVFDSLPPGRWEEILDHADEAKRLARDHIIEGRKRQIDLVEAGQVRTLQGARFRVEQDTGTHVGKARLVQHDIDCENGVYHVTDGFLAPP